MATNGPEQGEVLKQITAVGTTPQSIMKHKPGKPPARKQRVTIVCQEILKTETTMSLMNGYLDASYKVLHKQQ